MWVKTYSKVYSGVSKEKVWRLWEDVNNWPRWDSGLEYCKFNGEFRVGTQFELKPIGAPKVNITISEVVPNVRFTDYCKFVGATMVDEHLLEETAEGLRVTSVISVKGWLQFIWVKLVAMNVANSVPKQMDALVALARSL